MADAPEAVQRGHELYWDAGCTSYHMPPALESTRMHTVAGLDAKVPSLWAVRHTGPWFHDGRSATLEAAVRTMWRFHHDRDDDPAEPTVEQIANLVACLEAR
ncbi:MAG: hypothetical protein ACXIU8_00610 [Alkalilacustris sp.]